MALNDKGRAIRESAILEVLAGTLGTVIGNVLFFGALYGLGTVELSAIEILIGLSAADGICVRVGRSNDKKVQAQNQLQKQ